MVASSKTVLRFVILSWIIIWCRILRAMILVLGIFIVSVILSVSFRVSRGRRRVFRRLGGACCGSRGDTWEGQLGRAFGFLWVLLVGRGVSWVFFFKFWLFFVRNFVYELIVLYFIFFLVEKYQKEKGQILYILFRKIRSISRCTLYQRRRTSALQRLRLVCVEGSLFWVCRGRSGWSSSIYSFLF